MLSRELIVKKDFKSSVVKFDPRSDRVCSLWKKVKYQEITFINILSPSEEKNCETKETFYSELNRERRNF